jgi:hypothetical protein
LQQSRNPANKLDLLVSYAIDGTIVDDGTVIEIANALVTASPSYSGGMHFELTGVAQSVEPA